MLLVYLVFLLLSLFTVKSLAFNYNGLIPYTEIAYTTSGLPCIGGCSHDTHTCIAQWPSTLMPCTVRNQLAPIYFTSLTRGHQKYCISNCGKFNNVNDWCFTTVNGDWDYCSSHIRGNQPGGSAAVGPTAYTKKGKLCISPCTQNLGRDQYYWCYYDRVYWDYCAPSALSKLPILTPDYNVGPERRCDDIAKLLSSEWEGWNSQSKARAGYVAEIANALDAVSIWDSNVVKKIHHDETGFESHILVNVRPDTLTKFPVIVKFNVGNNTIHDYKNTKTYGLLAENDRDVLPGRKFNGPDYYVPLSMPLRDIISKLEHAIVKWYFNGRGSVDLLLVIFYPNNINEVPLALGINVCAKHKDDSIYFQCDDSIYFNNV